MTKGPLVRFAFKTAPQNTTWADMLEVWRAADDIDLFASGSTSVHIRVPESGDLGPLVDEAAAYAEAGMDLGIVYFPPPHPAALEPVADALRPLAG